MKTYGYKQVASLPTNASLRDVVFLLDAGDGGSLYEYNGSNWVNITTSNYAQYKPTHTVTLTSTSEEVGVSKTWVFGNPIPIDSAATFPVGARFKIAGIALPAVANILIKFMPLAPELYWTEAELSGLISPAVQIVSIDANTSTMALWMENSSQITIADAGPQNSILEIDLLEATSIGQIAFRMLYGSTSIIQRVASPTVLSIGANAFENCASLQIAHFPAAVNINSLAFNQCSALTLSVGNFSSCSVLGGGAFLGCTSLPTYITQQHFPALQYLGSNVFAYSSVTNINLPTVTSAATDGSIFSSAMTSITLDGLLAIDGQSFMYCTVEDMSFAACTSVGTNAFISWNPGGLAQLVLSSVTTWGNDVFLDVIGQNIELTIRADQASNPNVLYLQANNSVTLTLV